MFEGVTSALGLAGNQHESSDERGTEETNSVEETQTRHRSNDHGNERGTDPPTGVEAAQTSRREDHDSGRNAQMSAPLDTESAYFVSDTTTQGSQPDSSVTRTSTKASQGAKSVKMAADGRVPAPGEIPCPDPSVHQHGSKLQDQASTAALYVTSPARGTNPREGILDENNKLSSKSAATSLKYARAQDLPSFPSVGIETANSGLAAATLANTNHKQFEYWKPNASSAAGKAALLAKDYKMAPLWQPELSAAGSKAALLAAKDGGKLDLWMPEATAEGNSAATLALRNKGLSPQLDYGYTPDGKKRALMAATGALSRSRSGSTPAPAVPEYPDAANSAHNALNAATVAHRPSTRASTRDANRIDSDAMRAARVQNIGRNVDREMFTEHPPVALEVEEKKHNDALRASAVSMAKQMYEYQQQRDREGLVDQGLGASAAQAVHARTGTAGTAVPDVKQQALQYIHLQEAAHKLAQERLAKLEPDENARMRAYYGYDQNKPRNRLSLRGRNRNRASSDAIETQRGLDADSDDEFQARKIRNQMSQLTTRAGEVDAKKQQSDRANLLAAAERKVQARMHALDERVFEETGKVTPAMMEEWEKKAQARAAKESEQRLQNHGKVHIGGGKFLDQSEIEAIAAARLQPTLNEINETAEKKRARDEEIRLDQQERERKQKAEKDRERELKADQKRMKNEDKAAAKSARAEKKAAAKIEKEAEKARKAEEKRLAKENKRKSKQMTKTEEADAAAAAITPAATGEEAAEITAPVVAAADEDRQSEPDVATAGYPDLERHISHVTASSSSSSSASSVSSASSISSDENNVAVDHDSENARAIAERAIVAAPVDEVFEGPTRVVSSSTEPETAAPATTYTAAAATTTEPSAATEPASEPTTTKMASVEPPLSPTKSEAKGGFRGFLGKLKRRSKPVEPKTDEQGHAMEKFVGGAALTGASSSSEPRTSAAATSSAAGATTATAGIDDDAASESSFRRHASASSFKRNATDLHSIGSSTSLSDSDDEDRGRVKGKARRANASDDEDEFEEARDTFDESLAPPPTYAGQPKSQSPVRETKFQEVL